MNYLKHIFYYTFYKNYRILISNTWVWKEVEYPGILDNTIYDSLDGKYSFTFTIWKGTKGLSRGNLMYIDDSLFISQQRRISNNLSWEVSKDVSQFFIMYHKDKLILPEDKLSYQRDKKLKELGI
jgi:hypothetical protein